MESKQARLRSLILNKDKFMEAVELLLDMQSVLHSSEISLRKNPTYFDQLWEGLSEQDFTVMPTKKDVTIAWNIWHITRIEDITANILIKDTQQVLDNEWLKRLNTNIKDTGNAMSDEEILDLSKSLDMEQLRNYRNAVGARTREIINSLGPYDIEQKVKAESVERILAEGGVTEHKDSIWLLDFWGRKNIAGILLMPITRHQIGHINDSMKLKMKISKIK